MAVPTVPERPAAAGPARPGQAGTRDDRAARARAQGRLRWELLSQLVQKDLKTKYQGSTLGFVWSLANPLLQLAIYYVIFTYVFDNNIPDYHVYLMAGLLAFTAFSGAVSGASTSVVGNAGLVKKVRFPLLVLPLSAVGFALVQLALQLPVLFGIAALSGVRFWGPPLVLIVPALALLVVFATALGVLVAALNVRYRDTSHFVEIAMLVWFWANPILYAANLVRDELGGLFWLYFLNPMATVVSTVQRAVYQQPYYTDALGRRQLLLVDAGYAFYLRNLLVGFAVSAVLLLVAGAVFRRLQADFAEEL
ncbi:MAG: ABC transporter permease [Actinomycetota bacterium]|nr:ABC transporter permease [Actinomycetota bacterium]